MVLSCLKYDLMSYNMPIKFNSRYIIIVFSHFFNDLSLYGPTAAFRIVRRKECIHGPTKTNDTVTFYSVQHTLATYGAIVINCSEYNAVAGYLTYSQRFMVK